MSTPHATPSRLEPHAGPPFPHAPQYRVHKDNFDLLMSAEASGLDWSFACPGPMFDAPSTSGARAGAREGVRAVVDEAPIALPGWSQLLPTAMLLPAFAAARRQVIRGRVRAVPGMQHRLQSCIPLYASAPRLLLAFGEVVRRPTTSSPLLSCAWPQLTSASYRDVAGVIVAHLEGGGPLSRKRVGFAAPESG